jgi:hypothetical protein
MEQRADSGGHRHTRDRTYKSTYTKRAYIGTSRLAGSTTSRSSSDRCRIGSPSRSLYPQYAPSVLRGCIYGEPAESELPVAEDYDGHPHSQYGASKRGVEEYLHTYEALYGLRWTSLALANVYGPRQDPGGEAGVVSIFGGRMLDGQPVTIYGDGQQTRDFVYVGDVVDARGQGARLAAEREPARGPGRHGGLPVCQADVRHEHLLTFATGRDRIT